MKDRTRESRKKRERREREKEEKEREREKRREEKRKRPFVIKQKYIADANSILSRLFGIKI